MEDQITRYFLGELDHAGKKELFKRLSGDPEAKELFAQFQNAWALANVQGTADKDGWHYLQDFKRKQHRKAAGIFLIGLSKYAAALLVGVLITWAVIRLPVQDPGMDSGYNRLTVPAGQRALLTLDDGSTVWLNAGSTLVYPGVFRGGTREVELSGEAYFDVATDPTKPFIVKSDRFCTRATGTQFNIFAYTGFYDVSLVKGKVDVYEDGNATNAIALNESEKLLWTNGHFVKGRLGSAENFLWKEGIYLFDDTPFSELIEKLQLYYDMKIVVENKTLLTHKYTGKFRQRDGIENVLKVIQRVYPFTYQKDENKNIIYIR